MDPLRIHAYKIHAIKKHKRQQFVSNVLLYSLLALACTLFCSSPLWYPPFCATFNVVFFFSIPKICSFFLNSKVLFIVGNLIVIFLVGESMFFTSKFKTSSASYSDVCYDKHKRKSSKLQRFSCTSKQDVKEKGASVFESYGEVTACELYDEVKIFESYGEEKRLESNGNEGVSLPAKDLKKLADDFIARINRQRRLEAEFCRS